MRQPFVFSHYRMEKSKSFDAKSMKASNPGQLNGTWIIVIVAPVSKGIYWSNSPLPDTHRVEMTGDLKPTRNIPDPVHEKKQPLTRFRAFVSRHREWLFCNTASGFAQSCSTVVCKRHDAHGGTMRPQRAHVVESQVHSHSPGAPYIPANPAPRGEQVKKNDPPVPPPDRK